MPHGHQVVIFAFGIVPDFKNNGTEAITAPADRTKLLRVIAPLVHQVDLIENLLRLLQTDAVLPLNLTALRRIELEAYEYITVISSGRGAGRGYDWVIAAFRA
jgi:hypothetical protein